MQCNAEYRDGPDQFSSFLSEDGEADLGKVMILEGYAASAYRRESAFKKVVQDYKKAQQEAKDTRAGCWIYGDCFADDAREFGMGGK